MFSVQTLTIMLLRSLVFVLVLIDVLTTQTVRMTNKRRQMSTSAIKLDFTADAVYNKFYQRLLNINQSKVMSIEPSNKVWFAITNGTIYALPLFGDYAGPFQVQLSNPRAVGFKLKFHFAPSPSLFSPSNHLLLALFNISSHTYHQNPSINRYLIVRTLSLALNLSDSLLTIHRINGSMIKVYFSCDFYSSKDLAYHIKTLINYYYSNRLQLIPTLPLPLIELSIIRLSKSLLTTTPSIELKKGEMPLQPRLFHNRTLTPARNYNPLFSLDQFYQPLVIVPVAIILIGLVICTIIAFCLCCHRRSSSSSTLLLPSRPSGQPDNKHLYRNYSYHKHRQEHQTYRKTHYSKDQRQYISKGIPVVFAEELEEKLELAHTPLVMRIEKAVFLNEQGRNDMEKMTL